jgi:adenosylcobinamide kinase/adenosylcobinamide-phosphate guanylyltransferase
MGRTILITGGARSGKSRLAEKIAKECGAPLCYVATAAAGDPEMAARIQLHQERRGNNWQCIEEPTAITDALVHHDGHFQAFLVDCVTLWLSNLLLAPQGGGDSALTEVERLIGVLPTLVTPVILVTNEVGMGIVPDNPLGRSFRDLAGEANELLAAASDEVYVTFAGLPLKLKG